MNINFTHRIDGVEKVYPTSTSLAAPDKSNNQLDSAREGSARSGFSTENEAPLRFPWLSWQTRQLELASMQASPYGVIPLLGKEIDQKV